MKLIRLKLMVCCLLLGLWTCLLSCQKSKEAKVIVTKQEFAIQHVSGHGYEITAKGEIQNTGEVDLKNVVVTGHCLSCPENIIMNTWFISDIEKTADEKAVIKYLPVGQKADFSFVGVAMYMSKTNEPPKTMPKKLEVSIVSFEPAG